MAEVMTETKPTTDATAGAAAIDAATVPSEPETFARSATGYEAFLADSSVQLKEIIGNAPSPKALTDRAQSLITNFFPSDEKMTVEQEASVAIVSKDPAGEEATPELTASSSSEGSKSKEEKQEEKGEEKESSWSEKISSTCQMDTACGRLELEFMKKDDAPPSDAKAVTEQGELLQLEGPEAPKPWTRQVSEATTGTMNSVSTKVSTKATSLMVALGLATKKDQALLTDYYKVKETPKEPEKSLSEKVQELQSNAAASVKSTLGMGPREQEKEKEMKQSLITDYDPSKAKEEDTTVEKTPDTAANEEDPSKAKEEVASVEKTPDTAANEEDNAVEEVTVDIDESVSVKTEAESKTVEPQQEKESLWKRMKGFFGKMKPETTPSCSAPKVEIPSCPEVKLPECADLSKVEIPSCPEVKLPECADLSEVKTPRIEIPSYSLFSCNPTVAQEDEPNGEAEKSEEPEKKPQTPLSPNHVPW